MFDIRADGQFSITGVQAILFKRIAFAVGVSEKELERVLWDLWMKQVKKRVLVK